STGPNQSLALALARKYVSNNTVASASLCKSTVIKEHDKGTLELEAFAKKVELLFQSYSYRNTVCILTLKILIII
ncbi:MAG: hypothetical protein V7K68_18995, partial [Nostoc sp.]|uniref:hypothetical protein n=1 Tax=Nostoc sp. TaxID=1180 RepID=UPI002FF5AE48